MRERELTKLIEVIGQGAFGAFKGYIQIIEILVRIIDPSYKLPRLLAPKEQENIDDRIRKIDNARENLQDAINAIDVLKEQANENKAALQDALSRIDEVQQQKQAADTELDTLRKLAGADTEAFRRVVGIPTKSDIWRERLLGFASGVIASIVASFIFILIQKLI